ncbi:MAG: SMC-Scp complex subunit ScpB [Pseudomonas sp.]|uniref:SMC-Scp complex subunit ScpB n=1 Tax=Pseudomonas sp. TaxID=306 RepID=UPI00339798C5
MNLTDPRELASLLEAFLLASGKPHSLERLVELFDETERPDLPVFKKALVLLGKSCEGRAFELKEVASGYRLQVREKYAPWVGRLWEERPQRYSRAMLETLALIAYRQPITRGEIEEIRGVAVNSHIVKTLLEREWVRVVGYRDVPGKPAMFATTRQFLDHFNLKSLDELPPLAALRELEPEPMLAFDEDLPVPAGLQARADAAAGEGEGDASEPREETSFRSLLAELDDMEQGLKIDFQDLPEEAFETLGGAIGVPALPAGESPEQPPGQAAEPPDLSDPVEPAAVGATGVAAADEAFDEAAELERAMAEERLAQAEER